MCPVQCRSTTYATWSLPGATGLRCRLRHSRGALRPWLPGPPVPVAADQQRNYAYGGDRAGRMHFPLEIAEAVRAEWPKDKPVFVRISSVDGVEAGWTI